MTNPDTLISLELQTIAAEINDRLEGVAGQKMGFSLVIFNTEENSRINYVSNCNREDVYDVLSLLLKSWKEGMPDIPGHEFN